MTNKRKQLTLEAIRTRGQLRLKAYLIRWKYKQRTIRWITDFSRKNGRQPNANEFLNWCKERK